MKLRVTLAVFVLSLGCNAASLAQLPPSMDPVWYAEQLSSPDKAPKQASVKRFWLQLGMARALAWQNRAGEAEVYFSQASQSAAQLSAANLELSAQQLRLDLLAGHALATGQWLRLKPLVAGFRPYTLEGRPKLTREAAQYAGCLLDSNLKCVKEQHDTVTALMNVPGSMPIEDFDAIRALAAVLVQKGFYDSAARFIYWTAQVAGLDADRRAEIVVQAIEYGMAGDSPNDDLNAFFEEARRLTANWKWSDPDAKNASKDVADINKRRGRILSVLLHLELQRQLLSSSEVRESYQKAQAIDDWGDIGDPINRHGWIRRRAEAGTPYLQAKLNAAFEQRAESSTESFLGMTVLLTTQGDLNRDIARNYLRGIAHVTGVPISDELRRLLGWALCNAGRCEDAVVVMLPIVDREIDRIRANAPSNASLQADVHQTAMLAGRLDSAGYAEILRRLQFLLEGGAFGDFARLWTAAFESLQKVENIELIETVARQVAAETKALGPQAQLDILWTLVRKRLPLVLSSPAGRRAIDVIEMVAAKAGDAHVTTLLNIARRLHGQASMIDDAELNRRVAGMGDMSLLVMSAVAAYRNPTDAAARDWGDAPLCTAQMLYGQAGRPPLPPVPLTEREAAILNSTQSRVGGCAGSSGLPRIAIRYLEGLKKKRHWIGDHDADAPTMASVFEVVQLPLGESRSAAWAQLVGETERLSSARRARSLQTLLECLDALQMSFSPEALDAADKLLNIQPNKRTPWALAAERLAMAHELGIRHSEVYRQTVLGAQDQITSTEAASPSDPAASLFPPLSAANRIERLLLGAQQRRDGSGCGNDERTALTEESVAFAKAFSSGTKIDSRRVYRTAQLNLYCGWFKDADSMFSLAVEPNTSIRQYDDALLWLYWRNDNAALGRTAEAAAATGRLYRIVEGKTKSPQLSTTQVRRLLDVVSSSGRPREAVSIARLLYERQCDAESRSVCDAVALGWIRASLMEAVGIEQATTVLKEFSKRPESAFRSAVAKVALDIAERVPDREDVATRTAFLQLADESLRGPGTKRVRVSAISQRRLGMAYACQAQWHRATDIAQVLHRRGSASQSLFDVAWMEAIGSGDRYVQQHDALMAGLALAPLEQLVEKGAPGLWSVRRLPRLKELVYASTAVPAIERAYVLLQGNRPGDAFHFLKREMIAVKGELQRLGDASPFIRVLLTGAANAIERPDRADAEAVLDKIVLSLNEKESSQFAPLAFRILAEMSIERGRFQVALQHLLSAAAAESRSTRPSGTDSLSTPEAQLIASATENLRTVVLERGVRSTVDPLSDPILDALAGLRQRQRVQLAHLVANHGETIWRDPATRSDLSFKILQAATIGPTALELINAWQADDDVRPEVRDALATLRNFEQSSEEARQRMTPPFFWARDLDGCVQGPDDGGSTRDRWTSFVKDETAKSGLAGFYRLLSERKSYGGERDFEEVLKESSAAEKVLSSSGGGYRALEELTAPKGLHAVQESLAPGSAVYFLVSSARQTFSALVTRDHFSLKELRRQGKALTKAVLEALVKEVRQRLDVSRPFKTPTASDGLYEVLFGPFQEVLRRVSTISIVARGPAENLPFSILVTDVSPAHGPVWFDDRYVWQFALAGRVSSLEKVQRPRRFVQFGPPTFTGVDACSQELLDQSGLSPAKRFCPIDDLVDVAALAVQGDSAAPAPQIFSGQRATKPLLRSFGASSETSSTDVLIVATHGLTPTQTKRLSGNSQAALAFPDAASPLIGDSLVTESDVANLRINSGEVILVACNSAAAGSESDENAFSGLVRSFFRAGARRVVATVASVPRETSLELIRAYFSQRLDARPVSDSLAFARRRMRESGLLHPAYWGGFVAIGPY